MVDWGTVALVGATIGLVSSLTGLVLVIILMQKLGWFK